VQLLLSVQLSSSQEASIGKNWINQFIKHYKKLCSKYSWKYDYQQAKCKDPELIKGWFTQFYNIIQKYRILEQDIYNIDETGFQMGVISTAKVVCSSETRENHAKTI